VSTMTDSPLHRIVFRPVRSGNMYEETIERILQAIALGVLEPGQRLPPERELASLLNISRVTLRDALRSLQESGYVESRPGRSGGTFVLRTRSKNGGRRVPRPSAEEAQGVLDMRWIIERGACEFAASRQLSAQDQATLKAALADCSKAGRGSYRQRDEE
jgi:DNA-binding FadR family transcriptional regulator